MEKITGEITEEPVQEITGRIDSREALVRAVRAGVRVKYLHFWGHRPRTDGLVGPSCLSQWWPSPFAVEGSAYATAEHWMMAAKARLFDDAEAERRVLAAEHPSQAKKAGRLARGFDEEIWKRERFQIVLEGSVHKFAAHPQLRQFLLNTGDRVLVEASPVDRVWGIGLAADDEAAADPERWRGPNLLGFALMEARERLRAE
ncbi:NADAR family protein [Streptomyces guryensis]|uniref:NADAR family protein n=1 Tax=Streptomyces guryensis TaxID=2886947 RepID=A0A9Q3VRF1_9ACTN|nr:NADAR family protein [Streptomyces guryensis]MCD9876772.1 NADAR family protein [Streptomyces guryensis]